MGFSHCTGSGQGMEPGTGPGSIGPSKLCRNVHTASRQGQGPGPIVSYCATPVPCTGLDPCPVQCD